MTSFLRGFVFCLLTLPAWALGQGRGIAGEAPIETSWRVALAEYDLVYNLYLEEAVWRLHIIELHPHQLPKSRSQHVFPTRDAALDFLGERAQSQTLRTQSLLAERSSVATEVANTRLWTAENQWNWEWEQRYADWVRANVTADFFERYNIATDCADVAYTLRWIFARENKLPAANRLPGTGVMMTHETMRSEWARLRPHADWHQDQRFRAALDYLMNFTYTHSLVRDAYPVAIVPESFLPGAFHVELFGGTGHTQFVYRTDYSDPGKLPFEVVASTVPRRVRPLFAGGFWNRQQNQEGRGGFLRFLWPEKVGGKWSLRAGSAMPHFSREQYQADFMIEKDNLSLSMIKRLKPDYDAVVHVTQGLSFLRGLLVEREGVVEEGYRVCSAKPCREGSADYEAWSTPSRDKRIGEMWNDLARFVGSMSSEEPRVVEAWNKALVDGEIEFLGKVHPLRAVLYQWRTGNYSSDPNDLPPRRWGVEPAFLADRALKSFRELMPARIQKVASNQCRSSVDCPLMSERWGKNVSSDEDASLQMWAYAMYTLCDFHRDDVCRAAMEEFKQREVEMRGQKRSLWAWALEVPWWIDDPRFGAAVRWGEERSRMPTLALPEGLDWFEVRENLLHGHGTREAVMFRLAGQNWQLFQRDDLKWVGFHDHDLLGLAQTESGAAQVVDLQTGQATAVGVFKDLNEALFFWGKDRLGMISGPDLVVLERNEGTWALKHRWPLWSPSFKSGLAGLYLVRSESPLIVDLRTPEIRQLEVHGGSVELGADLQFQGFVAETPSRYLLKLQRRASCQEAPCAVMGELTVAVDKTTRHADETNLLVNELVRMDQGQFALHISPTHQDHLRVVELDSELNVASVIKEYPNSQIGGLASREENYHYLLLRGRGNSSFDLFSERLNLRTKRMESSRKTKEERLVYTQGSRQYLWSDNIILRDFDGTETLLSGDSFWSLGTESDWHIMGRNQFGTWGLYHLPTSRQQPVLTGRYLPMIGAMWVRAKGGGPPPAPGWSIVDMLSYLPGPEASHAPMEKRHRILKFAPGVQFLIQEI